MLTIRACGPADFDAVYATCNEGALAYRGAIAADQWKEPYLSADELRHEIEQGVRFFGAFDDDGVAGVMGLQNVGDVALIRHAYVRTNRQRSGTGSTLLAHLRARADRPVLVGTWKAAVWAIAFYERHGFRLVEDPERERLLRRYWSISDRQVEESVVMK